VTKTDILAVIAFIVVLGVGGNIWLLAQEARGRIRTRGWNARLLHGLSVLSAAVVLGTAIFARPWYWDLVLALVTWAALVWTIRLLRVLRRPPAPSLGRAVGASTGAVGLGVILLGLAGVAAVLDAAALSSPVPVLAYHGGGILPAPVVYQIFWGSEWHAGAPSLRQAQAFEEGLHGSQWARAVAASGFGVKNFSSGGCWIDPSQPSPRTVVSGTASGPFPDELQAVFSHAHNVEPCSESNPLPVPTILPVDAIVALWLPPDVSFRISGVAAHGATSWPGLGHLLVVAGLPGGYAYWGLPSCRSEQSCAAIPSYAAPTYALSHEILEAATNPYGGGWYAPGPLSWTARYVLANGPPSLLGFGGPPPYPGEVADLCAASSLAPGQHLLVGRLDRTDPLPVAAFFRPGVGCIAG
jgi:hypothetical protein